MTLTLDQTIKELTEIIGELHRPPGREPGDFTAPELAQALGWSNKRTYRALDKLVAEGSVVPGIRVPIVDRVGRESTTFGYRLTNGNGGATLPGSETP